MEMYEDLVKRLRAAYVAYYDPYRCMPYDIDKTVKEAAEAIVALACERDAAVEDLRKLVPAWRWDSTREVST